VSSRSYKVIEFVSHQSKGHMRLPTSSNLDCISHAFGATATYW